MACHSEERSDEESFVARLVGVLGESQHESLIAEHAEWRGARGKKDLAVSAVQC